MAASFFQCHAHAEKPLSANGHDSHVDLQSINQFLTKEPLMIVRRPGHNSPAFKVKDQGFFDLRKWSEAPFMHSHVKTFFTTFK